jgi:hypothetical protein
MVEHRLIYSLERKQWSHTKLQIIFKKSLVNNGNISHSVCRWSSFRNVFFFASPHDSPISAGFQLTLFTRARQAGPF